MFDFSSVLDVEVLLPLIRDLALLVFVTVQGLKVYKIVNGDNAGKVALGSSFGFALLVALKMLMPDTAPYVDLSFGLFVGASLAGLFYKYFAKPFLEKLGVPVSVEDLNGS